VAFAPRVTTTTAFLQFTTFPSSINAPYVEGVRRLLSRYEASNLTTVCPDGAAAITFPEQPCQFPLTSLGPCAEPEASLKAGLPCIYLRLNRVYGWLPDLANDTVFPEAAIGCYGQNDIAKFQLGDPEYFPQLVTPSGEKYAKIPSTYFPFIGQAGYQAPLAAVRFPNIMKNTVVLVECKVYGLAGVDSEVMFEIAVDGRKSPTIRIRNPTLAGANVKKDLQKAGQSVSLRTGKILSVVQFWHAGMHTNVFPLRAKKKRHAKSKQSALTGAAEVNEAGESLDDPFEAADFVTGASDVGLTDLKVRITLSPRVGSMDGSWAVPEDGGKESRCRPST
ncbi:sodium / potassium ATPase beta chain, partial [Opisthorchis viverrini]